MCLACVALVTSTCASLAHAQSKEFRLDESDRWQVVKDLDSASDESQLFEARKALAAGDPGLAKVLANRFLEGHPLSGMRAEAYLIRGDAKVALFDEYEALYDYEEIARKYPASEVFVTALEREFSIAKQYAAGMRRKLWGTIRIVSTYDDAQELLIRIQERLPGSELAERAGMALADFYFAHRELALAAEAYDLFILNYPKSPWLTKARLRLIYSYLAAFKGPAYDGTGLFEAKSRLRDLQVTEPALAQEIGADAILVRVYESEANKLLATANWYWQLGDAISTELFVRRIIKQYPDSVACLDALRVIPTVLEKLPQAVIAGAPNYQALRAAKLRVAWNEVPKASQENAAPPSAATLPATPEDFEHKSSPSVGATP